MLPREGVYRGAGPVLIIGKAQEGAHQIEAERRTDTILGVHIIGPDTGTMIPEAVLAMAFGAAAEDIVLTSHAHPTLPEAIREAALVLQGRPMHI